MQQSNVFNALISVSAATPWRVPSGIVEYDQYNYCDGCQQWVWQGRYLPLDADRHVQHASERAAKLRTRVKLVSSYCEP